MTFLFCTTNSHKFTVAKHACDEYKIAIEQLHVEVDEVQSEDPIYILEHKARSMYEKVKKPLLVSDDSWNIPALNGFPGPYMKSINKWFAPEDWLSIMSQHSDKRIFLECRLAYIDETGIAIFEDIQEREFLKEVSPIEGVNILRVVALKGSKTSLAQQWQEDSSVIIFNRTLWHDFIKWYSKK